MVYSVPELYSDDFYTFTPAALSSGRTRTFYIRNRGRKG